LVISEAGPTPVDARDVIGHPVTMADSGVGLLVPSDDVAAPEVSIVIPALNEELTIADFVAWCHEGLARAGVAGEILIVDSSTDRTSQRALAAGARVLRAPRRGLGRAPARPQHPSLTRLREALAGVRPGGANPSWGPVTPLLLGPQRVPATGKRRSRSPARIRLRSVGLGHDDHAR